MVLDTLRMNADFLQPIVFYVAIVMSCRQHHDHKARRYADDNRLGLNPACNGSPPL